MKRITEPRRPRRKPIALDLSPVNEAPPTVPPVSNGATQPAGDQDQRGRFVKGNQAARGQHGPFAKKCAALRAALVGCVSEDDIRAVAAKLLSLARNGNLRAAELLLAYLVPKAEPVDPDDENVPPGEPLTHKERNPPRFT